MKLFTVDHKISDSMRPGQMRNAVYSLEVCWAGLKAWQEKAASENVASPQVNEKLEEAKAKTLAIYNRIKKIYDTETSLGVDGQAEADLIWAAVHDAREAAYDFKQDGYDALPPYGPNASFFNSTLDAIAWAALRGLSNAAGFIGLSGEPTRAMRNDEWIDTREAEYVNGFESISNQDPLARKVAGVGSGSDGIGIGGSFSDVVG